MAEPGADPSSFEQDNWVVVTWTTQLSIRVSVSPFLKVATYVSPSVSVTAVNVAVSSKVSGIPSLQVGNPEIFSSACLKKI